MPQISLLSNERVFICGKTGSGKTFLAKYLTKRVKRLVVLDGKGTLGKPDWNLEPWSNNVNLEDETFRYRAFPPLKTDLIEYWDEILERCLKAGNITVYIDELYSVCPPNKNPSPTLFACYTRGREYGLGLWASTQRPVWIPLVALSEAEHFFVFRLQLMEDKQRLAAFMGNQVMYPIRDAHGFFYMKAIDDKVNYFKQFNPVEPVAKVAMETKQDMPDLQKERERKIQLFRRMV